MMKIKTKITPVRYPGGKSNALKFLDSKLIKTFDEYREPFFGGGSVGLYLMQFNTNAKYWINDAFYPVYCFWKMVYNNPSEMIKQISDKKSEYTVSNDSPTKGIPSKSAENGRKLHEWCRNEIQSTINAKNELATACWWYILNKTSYSGMAMIGSYAPLAWDQNFSIKGICNIANIHNLMHSVEHPIKITCLDYSELLVDGNPNTFVFLDPPYDITHTLYGNNGDMHKGFDHVKFSTDVKNCNHKWMITYNNNDDIKNRFDDYSQEEWSLTYTMKASKRSAGDAAKIKHVGRSVNQTDKRGKEGKELLIWNW